MKVLVVAGTNFGHSFWDSFCEYGSKHFEAEFSVITKTEYTNSQFIKHKKSNVNYYIAGVQDIFYPKYSKFQIDKESLCKELIKFEQNSGFLITDIIQADRNLGRGFYFAGHQRPSCTLSQNKTYWDTVQFIYEYIKYFNEILDKVHPDVVIIEGGCSVEANTLLACVHNRNIPLRRISTSRYKNYFHWSFSEKETLPYFKEFFQAFEHDSSVEMEIKHGYKMVDSPDTKKRSSIFSLLKKTVKFSKYRMLSFLLKKYKGYHSLLDTFYLESLWVWIFREYYLTKKLKTINKKQTLTLEPQKYCYFPLHIEPEDSLCVCAPEFNNQIGVIDTLAKSLPVGVVLAIKEHPHGISVRPPIFYDWLKTVPNVYIASLDMNGPELAKNSLFTATITGTSGLEAAINGVPVITFSQNILYTHMKHVRVVTDFIELRNEVGKLCYESQNREENFKEGQRYLQALCALSMDFVDETIIRNIPSDSALEKLWDGLNLSLQPYSKIIDTLQHKRNAES